jgi:peptidoglycan hydrolase CwlO-like protein
MEQQPHRCVCGCQSEIESLKEQVQKLTAERDLMNLHIDELYADLKVLEKDLSNEDERKLEKLIQQQKD